MGLNIQEVQRDMLLWDYSSIFEETPGRGLKRLGLQRVPTQFEGLREYCRIFRVLLLEELKAHLVQVSLVVKDETAKLGLFLLTIRLTLAPRSAHLTIDSPQFAPHNRC